MTSATADIQAKLRSQYLEQLPARLESILEIFNGLDPANWHPVDAETLHRLLHGITGSAGTFGMHSVSDAARKVEELLSGHIKSANTPTPTQWKTFASELKRLIQVARIRMDTTKLNLKVPPGPVRLNHLPMVHIVEDDLQQADSMSKVLIEDGYRTQIFHSTQEFRLYCASVENVRPDAIIMDMIFPEGDAAGAELIAELKASKARCPPIIFISARDDLTARLTAFRAGATRYLDKPVKSSRLLDLLDALTGRQPSQAYRVLMVDDDPQLLEAQAAMLREVGMEVRTLSDPLKILETMNSFTPDVVVLDVYMPDASGPELAAVLRERDDQVHIPILFLSAEADITQQLIALNLGGDDFLVKPVQPDHLVAAVTARARRARQNSSVRQRLETTLYEREREHHALNQHAIVSIADRAGIITYANDKFCEISGYTHAEIIGQNHRLLKSGKHPDAFYKSLWKSIASGKVWQGEICNRRKDGSFYWVESTITPFVDGEGKPYQYVSIRTDITHMKAAELALRESSRELNEAQAMAHIGSWQSNLLTGEAIWSDENYRILGYEPGAIEANAKNLFSLLYPEDLPLLQNATKHVELEGYAEVKLRIVRPDGSIRHLYERMRGEKNEDGKLLKIFGVSQDITDQIQSAQEIEASKERLRRGQMFANIGTWDWNIQSGELFWTERIAPLFGYPVGELDTTYENFIAAIHPDDRQAVIDAINACVEYDVPYEIEHRVIWPNGTVRWLLERGAVARDKQDKPLQMLGVVQDIDDRKRAELAVAEREHQLSLAQTLARIGNWSTNIKTGEFTCSDEIYRIFGHEPGSFEFTAEAFKAAIHPDDTELVQQSEDKAKTSGQLNVVHSIVWPDGTVRYVHELAQIESVASENPFHMTGTVQDITERVEAETLLRESEAKLSGLFELSPLGIVLADMHGNYLEFNEAFSTICGYPAEELKTLDYWALTPKTYENQEAAQLESLAKTGRYGPYEKEYRQKNGNLIPIRLNGILVKDQSGESRIWSIVENITDSKNAEQALIKASEEANQANMAKSEFLSSMSHELRTPMNAILGFGQLLQYDDTLGNEQKDSVQEIIKAGDHLLELINEVLDLAKVESGRIDLSIEPVELCPVFEECISLITIMAEKRDIKITHGGLKGIGLRADRTRLKQVLLNLLSNAIKYNREGGDVHIDVKNQGTDRIQILVSDTGPGIPANRMQELFKPFNRLDAENSGIEGTGIGLTISRRIVELMGGSVDVKSELGVGSTFWIELPIEKIKSTTKMKEAKDILQTEQAEPEMKHLVLYIEDNPSNLRLMAQILGRRKRIHLLTAHTPELGIELALARHPDLILLDINMPGMDGYQVLKILKMENSLKHIPVIAVTANAMPRDIEQGMQAGFNNYLTKPIDIRQLNEMLDKHLHGDSIKGTL